MDKSEYERRSVELYAQYEDAKRANEQNPVREQRSKALKEAHRNYERKQNTLTAEYEAANPAVQSKSSEKPGSTDWSGLWWLIPLLIVAGGRAYMNTVERESQQNDPPTETLPQEERR